MDSPTAVRIVPGAPPPTPLSKSQKKKRSSKRKPADSPVESPLLTLPNDNAKNGVAEKSPVEGEPREETTPQVRPVDDLPVKSSPIIELLNKRAKATAKKIGRITTYAAMDLEKLNDDQRATLTTLPALEAVLKELKEFKKVIEIHEAELAQELASKQAESKAAEKARLARVVTETESANVTSTSDILGFLRLQSALSAGQPDALALNLDEVEGAAIFACADILLGSNIENKRAVIHGFFTRVGEFQGTTFARLLEITNLYIDPPIAATSSAQEESEDDQDHADLSASVASTTIGAETEAQEGIHIISNKPSTGSFDFMQASELDPQFGESSTEWVQEPEGMAPDDETLQSSEGSAIAGNGHVYAKEPDLLATPREGDASLAISGALDWAADDESGLPPIDGLHAKFGTPDSGATPVTGTPVGEMAAPGDAEPQNSGINGMNTDGEPVARNGDDGFTQARGGRGRSRAERGERGFMRGGFRGARGERGFRNFRGGDRGFRGRPAPSGEWRGDGESRGRGRGRGRGSDRGGFNENRGGTLPT